MRKTALQNKLTLNNYSSNGKHPAERLLISSILRCFQVVWNKFWTSSKCLLAHETSTNNQEVKWSLYRLQNVNNLSKHCIARTWVVQLYRSCWTSRIHLFEFINISDHSRLINSNLDLLQRKSLIFYFETNQPDNCFHD